MIYQWCVLDVCDSQSESKKTSDKKSRDQISENRRKTKRCRRSLDLYVPRALCLETVILIIILTVTELLIYSWINFFGFQFLLYWYLIYLYFKDFLTEVNGCLCVFLAENALEILLWLSTSPSVTYAVKILLLWLSRSAWVTYCSRQWNFLIIHFSPVPSMLILQRNQTNSLVYSMSFWK